MLIKKIFVVVITVAFFWSCFRDDNPIDNNVESCDTVVLHEGFEGILDEKINFDIAGEFSIEPVVIDTYHFGSSKAFSFGLSTCSVNCFDESEYYNQPFRCIIRITFPVETYVCSLSLKWAEIDGNWGSGGHVYADGEMITDYPEKYIGLAPPSNHQNDDSVHELTLEVKKQVNVLDIAVWDIANGSQIYIDDIKVYSK